MGNDAVNGYNILGLKIHSECPLDSYLESKGVTFIRIGEEGDYIYSRELESATNSTLEIEILTAMLKAGHTFKLKSGETSAQCIDYLKTHVNARQETAKAAETTLTSCMFGSNNLNQDWGNTEFGFVMNRRGKWRTAIAKLLERVEGVQMGCSLYSEFAIHIGTYEAGEQTAQYYTRAATGEADWIPGDRGYIDNESIGNENATLTAEYLIYLGKRKFYGHFPSGDNSKSLEDWKEIVDGWSPKPGDITIDTNRNSTGAGLR